MLENATVRILKISYAPGGKSIMHSHPDAIVIPLSASKVRFALPDGKSQDMDLASESAMYTPAGTHNPTNVGAGSVDALQVEFKAKMPGKAVLPTSRPGMTNTVAEGSYGTAYRSTASATFAEPAGSKHDFDQVVIALGPGRFRFRSTGSLRRPRGHVVTCSSSDAESRTRPGTPAGSRRIW